MLHPYADLSRVLTAIRAARPGAVLVLGGVDTGKTTLVRHAAAAMAADGPVWVVAADTGQAWLGPPTTAARVRLRRPPSRWSRLRPERMIFTGATSPAPCPTATAEALVRLAREGVPAGEHVLIDTPGLVTGSLAGSLWATVAEGLRPVLIIAVEKERELTAILESFRRPETRILRLRPDPAARRRSQARRTAYREAAYRRYFSRAEVRRLTLDGTRPPSGVNSRGRQVVRVVSAVRGTTATLARGRLVALRDEAGWDVALGVVRSAGVTFVDVGTPRARLGRVTAVVTGTFGLNPVTGVMG